MGALRQIKEGTAEAFIALQLQELQRSRYGMISQHSPSQHNEAMLRSTGLLKF